LKAFFEPQNRKTEKQKNRRTEEQKNRRTEEVLPLV
jgi:hypothetical protein